MIVALVLFTALKGRLLHVKIFFNIKWINLYLAILYAFVLASHTVAVYLSSRVPSLSIDRPNIRGHFNNGSNGHKMTI